MLKPVQYMAISLLLSEARVSDVADKCGIGETTLRRWLRDDEFKGELAEAQNELVSAAIARLTGTSTDAVNVLVEVMSNKNAPAVARVRSADLVLQHRQKFAELNELSVRLADIEAALGIDQHETN